MCETLQLYSIWGTIPSKLINYSKADIRKREKKNAEQGKNETILRAFVT